MVEPQVLEGVEDPRIDHNHPLHLLVSNISGIALIPIKLTGLENYGVWRRSMRLVLLVENKLGFINGTCTKCSYKSSLAEKWEA